MNIRDLGIFANAVYGATSADVQAQAGRPVLRFTQAGGAADGFQAAAFDCDQYTVIAFRGTAQAMDGIADIKLGAGMNSTYFAAGEEFVNFLPRQSGIVLCGHSLGGAIAQVVANRTGWPMVTFNAPGVGVLASRELLEASPTMTAIRVGGMALSALRHPFQAVSDIRSAFNRVKGLNVCLQNDLVSAIGLHYGDVRRIPGTSANPLTEHRMTTMNTVLATDPVGNIDVGTF